MAIVSKEAGPEWEYYAGLVGKNSTKVEFDYLYVNIQRQGDEQANIIDSLQALSSERGIYVPSSVLRFSFDKLKGLIGPESDRFDLFFQAFEGAESEVAIPDSRSFRRLLVAIGNLGLPVPQPATVDDHPPVLRFIARLTDSPGPVMIAIDTPPPFRPREVGKRTKPPHRTPEETPTRRSSIPVRKDVRAGPSKSSPLAIPGHPSVRDEPADSSFLPRQEPEKELTFEERVEEHDLDYGFSDRNGVHDVNVHNLYADIAGISRHMRDPENPRHEYKPPYSSVSLPPHQTYPTGWMLSDSERIFHYLADKPGTGKTFAACEAMIRIMMIISNGIAIENELANLSTLRERPNHIHDEAYPPWPKNTECRANTLSKYGFLCQCDKKSPLYEMAFTFAAGFMLVMVPVHLTGQWFTEINRFIRSSTRLPHNQKPIEVVNIRGLKGSPGENLKDFFYGGREHHGLGTICIVPTTTTVSSSLKAIRREPQQMRQQCSIVVLDEIQSIKSVEHESVELVQQLIYRAEHPVHVLALSGSAMTTGPSNFNVVESIALNKVSFEGWYGEEEYKDYKDKLLTARQNLDEYAKQINKSGIVGRGQRSGLPDEEKAEAHNLMKAYDQRCREYAMVVPLLQRKALDNYLGYRIPQLQPESEMAQIIRCDSSMDNVQKQVANSYKQYLRHRYQHRVRVWSRKPQSTRGPRPKMREVLFDLDAKQAVVPKAPVTVASIGDASLIGFAPGLAKSVLKRSNDSQQFRAAEANEIFRGTTTTTQRIAVRNSPFWDRAEDAFQKMDEETGQEVLQPKIRAICRIIDEMLADREQHGDGPNQMFGLFQKKAVICVPHAWQGYILIAYLFRRYPNRNFTFVGAGNTPEERERLIAPFKRSTEVRDPAADGRNDDPIALIGTYNIIGTGLNLTRCNYAIATSPLGSMGDQVQFFARINRKGQYATTHTYVLVDQGNPVDVCTYHRLQKRTALTVPEDEMGQPGLEFLLDDIDEEDDQDIDPSFESGAENSD